MDSAHKGKRCAVFLLCAVLLHYASCDLNMYCLLQKKVNVGVRKREECISPYLLTRSVSVNFVHTVHGGKAMHSAALQYPHLLPRRKNCENLLWTLPFAFSFQVCMWIQINTMFCFCLLLLDPTSMQLTI